MRAGSFSVKNRPGRTKTLGPSDYWRNLLEQLQESLRRGIGLRQCGNGRLLQHLDLVRLRLPCDVRVSNARLRRRIVGDLGLGQTDGVVQIVFAGADRACVWPSVWTALVMSVIAVRACAAVSIASLLIPSPLESTMLPLPLKLMVTGIPLGAATANVDGDADVFAALAPDPLARRCWPPDDRLPEQRRDWLFSVARLPWNVPEADCVAKLLSWSRMFEMLFRPPSMVCRYWCHRWRCGRPGSIQ